MFTTKTTNLGHTQLWSSLAVILGLPINKEITIDSVFKNGELGWYYDFNDLSVLYQDVFGTKPVTSVGQGIGLVLDKSKGLTRSSEKLSNNAWQLNMGWMQDGNTLYCNSVPQNALAVQYGVVEANCIYEITFTVDSISSGSLVLKLEGSWTYNIPTVAGTYRIFITSENNGALYIRSAVVGTTASISDISCKQIYGNHAYQVTPSLQPKLKLNPITGYYCANFDGAGSYLKTNNIDLSTVNIMSFITSLARSNSVFNSIVFEFSQSTETNNGSFSLASSFSNGIVTYNSISKGTISASLSGDTDKLNSVINSKLNIAASLIDMEVNGISYQSSASQGTGNYSLKPLYIGSRAGTSLHFKGDIYSLLGVSRELTSIELLQFKNDARNAVGN